MASETYWVVWQDDKGKRWYTDIEGNRDKVLRVANKKLGKRNYLITWDLFRNDDYHRTAAAQREYTYKPSPW